MTMAAFQSSLAELVASGKMAAGENDDDLSDLERRRLAGIAGQNGKDVMQMLYFSWRLTKVLSLLPLTTRLLGDEETAVHLKRFWGRRTAKSLYFVEECLSFLDFLVGELEERPAHFDDVVGFERARLTLRDDQSKGRPSRSVEVRFHCNPDALISALMSGGDLSAIAADQVVLCGRLGESGGEQWIPMAVSGANPAA